MRAYTTFSAAFAALVATGRASTSTIEGYGISDFTWEVETFPGGPKKNITGTVQDVVAELSAINPNWENDFPVRQRDLSFPWTGILCDIRLGEWGYATGRFISEGVYYLNHVPGTPTAGPGPGNCGRVSCSYNSAIYWCNDAGQTFSLPGYSTIAAGADVILGTCGHALQGTVNGQIFAQFLQNWNVIVRGDSC